MSTISPDDETRARIQRLAARGVPAPLVHVLVGFPKNYKTFARTYRAELVQGAAEADAAVSEALFDLALSGKSPPVTLAWAKQRLGWSVTEDATNTAHTQATRDSQTATAMATLRTLLDQLAAGKSGSDHGPPQLVEECPPIPASTGTG